MFSTLEAPPSHSLSLAARLPLVVSIALLFSTWIPGVFAVPQTQVYAPFSGALYIVGTNGQPVPYVAGTSYCPNTHISCAGAGPSWCCPNTYTCVAPTWQGGMMGCCPSGQSCSGQVVAQAAVSTYTVQAVVTQAVVQNPVVVAQPTVVVETPVVAVRPTTIMPPGFCATIVANGPGLPAVREGSCGMVLVVSAARDGWRDLLWTGSFGTLAVGAGVLHLIRRLAWA